MNKPSHSKETRLHEIVRGGIKIRLSQDPPTQQSTSLSHLGPKDQKNRWLGLYRYLPLLYILEKLLVIPAFQAALVPTKMVLWSNQGMAAVSTPSYLVL